MSWLENQLLLGTFMTLISVVFHVFGLILLAKALSWLPRVTSSWSSFWSSSAMLVLGLIPMILLHLIEALVWAWLYLSLGEFDDLTQALYFSVTTSTTLGYGDLTLSSQWQLLSTFEAIAGLLLFGASTAFLLALMKSMFKELGIDSE